MAKKEKIINWKKVWAKFHRWFDKEGFARTGWDDQKRKIEELIEENLTDNYEF